jgi:tRNA threonylcarbamoyladenosine biosynthesis protein TsaB
MIVLAVDTAHAACSACILDSATGTVLACASEPMQQGHAERLAPMVDELLREAGLTFPDIDRLAACSGPGTFTGVRIGLAFVRGLALVLEVPVVGVTSLQALAQDHCSDNVKAPFWVVQDARRSQVYLQPFDASGNPLSDAEVLDVTDATQRFVDFAGTITGSGAGLVEVPAATIITTSGIPDIASVARLAAIANPGDAPAAPFYLRGPDAKAQAPLVRHQMVPVSIKQVGGAHAGVLAEIHATGFDQPWDEGAIRELLDAPGCIGLLASTGEAGAIEPAGFLLARKAADEMEILSIAVLPSSRRRGVGQALLGKLRQVAREAGSSAIFIEFAATNDAAAALYKAEGFCPTGVRKNYYHVPGGTRTDAITARLEP